MHDDIERIRRDDPRGLVHLIDNLGSLEDLPFKDADRAATLRSLLAEARALAADVRGGEPRPAT